MKKMILFIALSVLSSSIALADVMNCIEFDNGEIATLEISDSAIQVASDPMQDFTNIGERQILKLDRSYKPHLQNIDSKRFVGGLNFCGTYEIIITKELLKNKKGRMVFTSSCASAGTGPAHINFSCK